MAEDVVDERPLLRGKVVGLLLVDRRWQLQVVVPAAELDIGLFPSIQQGITQKVVQAGSNVDFEGQLGQDLVRLGRIAFAATPAFG